VRLVRQVTGNSYEVEVPADLQGLEKLAQRVEVMDPDVNAVKAFIQARV